MSGYHLSRRRMAVRAQNAAREAAGTLVAQDPTVRPLGALVDPQGLLCGVCGLTIKATPTGRIKSHDQHGNSPKGGVSCPGVPEYRPAKKGKP